MKRLSILLLVSIMSVAMAMAQQNVNPVRWRMSVKMNTATEGTITMRATIEQGWHLYGTTLPEDGPHPTKFDFSKSVGITLTGNLTPTREPMTKLDEMFGLELNYWNTEIEFTQRFKVTDASKATVEAVISFMSCNDENCMPPKSVTLKTAVPAAKQKK